ncbi:uncharacterized protein LOC119073785 isoform X2 [Bradysia coprophila]|uniref:uncharacterized protein LOC119073785 isoform X2 n=1 Tax=Bradysia coprophila TaxID=38358 RepID=UPI00187DCF19|nr:uncharacterized protein LOC119073785 isoform X2 [Bradysia coprophila]
MLKFTLSIIVLASGVLSWKPIVSPSSFSISQHHPALGQSHNTLSDGADTSAESTVTYHGNSFLNHHAPGHALIGSDEDTEARVVHSGGAGYHYGPKYLSGLLPSTVEQHCSVDKFAVEHEGTVQYEQSLPKMDQFTICTWMRFTNHSGDHVLFTYSVDHEPREIQFWIANSKGASFFSLAVHGQSLFRLNYPVRMRKWHHACASWNGKTGEWQLWVKAERVGRGFHNRIVGETIKPNGILFSGGPSITGPVADDLHMEITMLQIYKVALSAGKAHRDHKHHHVHHFDHEGPATSTTTLPPPTVHPNLQAMNPLLANGQITTRLRINLAGAQPPNTVPVQGVPSQIFGGAVPAAQHATIGTQFVSGQFSPAARYTTQQLLGSQYQTAPAQQSIVFPSSAASAPTSYAQISDPSDDQYLDTDVSHGLFKRSSESDKIVKKRETASNKKLDKRALVTLTDGSVIDDRVIASNPFDFDGLAQFGAPAFQEHLNKMMDIEDEIKEHDREPAEGEVQAVLDLCSACDVEPFEGAIVLSWKDVKVTTEHALSAKSLGGCGQF